MRSPKPKASVVHLQVNISDARRSLPFYKAMLACLGYRVMDESLEHLAAGNGTTDLWFVQSGKTHIRKKFHRKSPGLNHLAFGVATPQAVRKFTRKFLAKRKIKTLYGSPRFFPEYRPGYYAVYFEDPDRIKWEVAYVPGRPLK